MSESEEKLGDDGAGRIRKNVERAIPDATERRHALDLLAFAVENANDERDTAWYLCEGQRGLTLYAGRLQACRVGRAGIELSVMGPLSDEVRAELGAEPEENEAWKAIPGGLLITVPTSRAARAMDLLRDPFDKFVDEAMSRVRRRVSLEYHSADALAYLSTAVGRELPQPSTKDPVEDDEDDDEPGTTREPRVRGRSPIFNHSQRAITSLISDIDEKTLALPDLQRPFVWDDTKVRDLLDSLFVGFPVGTLVLWHVADGREARAIGGPDALRATTLVIDGQQRLTSLYAVMRGAEITDKDGSRRKVTIAFRPRDGRFEVADAAIRNNPEFLPDVSELWKSGKTKGQIRRDLLRALREKGRQIDEVYESAVEENLDRLQAISDYPFPVVDIQKSAASDEAKEEDVAEVFVRINNQGKRLGQADFVLTLLSVFHGPLRDKIELRASEMSRDAVIEVDTQQLLRAACAVGFSRAKMSAVYRFLRGVDPTTGEASVSERRQRLEQLDRAAELCIDQMTWRDYMLRVVHSGMVSQALVASTAAVTNAYALYVLGRRCGVQKPILDSLISRWLFATALTARYSGSAESVFEQDLARVRSAADAGDAAAFVSALDGALSDAIVGDYWTQTLPRDLDTQKGRAPSALAFRAAQVVLGARALFSDQPLRNLLAPPGKARRSAGEMHHLFPQAWLISSGIRERRRINQVANLADVGWWENNVIGARPPGEYVPRIREMLKLDDDRWGRSCAEHALPLGWEKMDYDTFLRERRQRMAELVRVAFRQLGGEATAPPIRPPWFLPGAEEVWRRIGETERRLRALVRTVYVKRFGDQASQKIEQAIPEKERDGLARALRARPAGADPLSLLDYTYLGQLPPLLFASDVWQDAKERLRGSADLKGKLQAAVQNILPVRNEIAHVREVSAERLQRASLACGEVLEMVVDPGA